MTETRLQPGKCYFEDLQVGYYFQTGRIVVTETHIVNFAGISGDFFDVHMDDEFARAQGFPARIAHGLLGLSLVDGLKNRADVKLQAVASLGWKSWNFTAPIVMGDSITARISVETTKLTSKGDRGVVELRFDVTNQDDVLVQTGCNVLLMQREES
ncbi:MAG: acyl dehydratase [Yoonia sp.]|jgi:3-hydroxybutyryl-CoA dehydratase|uniref:MaoC dehydratase-like protein n=1 Tax=Octadecabacter arcticus 238 TaxID=391616 RepID=M9RQN3_9RHOB|nr:MaoC/PaaZ C-terminal domain-containing protein [Octadecabacter arcticus]AGI74919.1 MaoC dehydratase-like protein [Octadecabacter arcticus 238]